MTPDEAVAVLRNYIDGWEPSSDDALDVVASLARDHAALLDWAERVATTLNAVADCCYAGDVRVLLAEWDEMRERDGRTG